ncbi:MAG: SDR family oxidoreductase [Spartobacteria bacterium]
MLPSILIAAAAAIFAVWCIARLIRTLRYSLRDRVAIITGGSRGLGLVIARHLCQHGAKVALLARDVAELGRAQTDLARFGGEVSAFQCDLTDTSQIQWAVRQILERFGKIDILINNAGIIEVGPLAHMQRQDFEQSMQLHFWGAYDLIAQVLPQMRKQRAGRIVNISSIGGKVAVPHLAAYSASKFALTGYSDSIRAELAQDNIKVTTVAPGLMRTGSHVNAKTKGDHDAEFAWFAIANATPIISMSADRAARKILAACRRGQPSLTLGFVARLAIVGNALFPNLTGYAMKITNRFLPGAVNATGDEARLGWDSRLRGAAPSFLTQLSDRASVRNNEQRLND